MLPLPLLTSRVIPALTTLARDPVPNVRFNAAKALGAVAARLEPGQAAVGVAPTLSTLMGDKDTDVRFFAGQKAGAAGRQ